MSAGLSGINTKQFEHTFLPQPYLIWEQSPYIFLNTLLIESDNAPDLSYQTFLQYYQQSPLPSLIASSCYFTQVSTGQYTTLSAIRSLNVIPQTVKVLITSLQHELLSATTFSRVIWTFYTYFLLFRQFNTRIIWGLNAEDVEVDLNIPTSPNQHINIYTTYKLPPPEPLLVNHPRSLPKSITFDYNLLTSYASQYTQSLPLDVLQQSFTFPLQLQSTISFFLRVSKWVHSNTSTFELPLELPIFSPWIDLYRLFYHHLPHIPFSASTSLYDTQFVQAFSKTTHTTPLPTTYTRYTHTNYLKFDGGYSDDKDDNYLVGQTMIETDHQPNNQNDGKNRKSGQINLKTHLPFTELEYNTFSSLTRGTSVVSMSKPIINNTSQIGFTHTDNHDILLSKYVSRKGFPQSDDFSGPKPPPTHRSLTTPLQQTQSHNYSIFDTPWESGSPFTLPQRINNAFSRLFTSNRDVFHEKSLSSSFISANLDTFYFSNRLNEHYHSMSDRISTDLFSNLSNQSVIFNTPQQPVYLSAAYQVLHYKNMFSLLQKAGFDESFSSQSTLPKIELDDNKGNNDNNHNMGYIFNIGLDLNTQNQSNFNNLNKNKALSKFQIFSKNPSNVPTRSSRTFSPSPTTLTPLQQQYQYRVLFHTLLTLPRTNTFSLYFQYYFKFLCEKSTFFSSSRILSKIPTKMISSPFLPYHHRVATFCSQINFAEIVSNQFISTHQSDTPWVNNALSSTQNAPILFDQRPFSRFLEIFPTTKALFYEKKEFLPFLYDFFNKHAPELTITLQNSNDSSLLYGGDFMQFGVGGGNTIHPSSSSALSDSQNTPLHSPYTPTLPVKVLHPLDYANVVDYTPPNTSSNTSFGAEYLGSSASTNFSKNEQKNPFLSGNISLFNQLVAKWSNSDRMVDGSSDSGSGDGNSRQNADLAAKSAQLRPNIITKNTTVSYTLGLSWRSTIALLSNIGESFLQFSPHVPKKNQNGTFGGKNRSKTNGFASYLSKPHHSSTESDSSDYSHDESNDSHNSDNTSDSDDDYHRSNHPPKHSKHSRHAKLSGRSKNSPQNHSPFTISASDTQYRLYDINTRSNDITTQQIFNTDTPIFNTYGECLLSFNLCPKKSLFNNDFSKHNGFSRTYDFISNINPDPEFQVGTGFATINDQFDRHLHQPVHIVGGMEGELMLGDNTLGKHIQNDGKSINRKSNLQNLEGLSIPFLLQSRLKDRPSLLRELNEIYSSIKTDQNLPNRHLDTPLIYHPSDNTHLTYPTTPPVKKHHTNIASVGFQLEKLFSQLLPKLGTNLDVFSQIPSPNHHTVNQYIRTSRYETQSEHYLNQYLSINQDCNTICSFYCVQNDQTHYYNNNSIYPQTTQQSTSPFFPQSISTHLTPLRSTSPNVLGMEDQQSIALTDPMSYYLVHSHLGVDTSLTRAIQPSSFFDLYLMLMDQTSVTNYITLPIPAISPCEQARSSNFDSKHFSSLVDLHYSKKRFRIIKNRENSYASDSVLRDGTWFENLFYPKLFQTHKRMIKSVIKFANQIKTEQYELKRTQNPNSSDNAGNSGNPSPTSNNSSISPPSSFPTLTKSDLQALSRFSSQTNVRSLYAGNVFVPIQRDLFWVSAVAISSLFSWAFLQFVPLHHTQLHVVHRSVPYEPVGNEGFVPKSQHYHFLERVLGDLKFSKVIKELKKFHLEENRIFFKNLKKVQNGDDNLIFLPRGQIYDYLQFPSVSDRLYELLNQLPVSVRVQSILRQFNSTMKDSMEKIPTFGFTHNETKSERKLSNVNNDNKNILFESFGKRAFNEGNTVTTGEVDGISQLGAIILKLVSQWTLYYSDYNAVKSQGIAQNNSHQNNKSNFLTKKPNFETRSEINSEHFSEPSFDSYINDADHVDVVGWEIEQDYRSLFNKVIDGYNHTRNRDQFEGENDTINFPIHKPKLGRQTSNSELYTTSANTIMYAQDLLCQFNQNMGPVIDQISAKQSNVPCKVDKTILPGHSHTNTDAFDDFGKPRFNHLGQKSKTNFDLQNRNLNSLQSRGNARQNSDNCTTIEPLVVPYFDYPSQDVLKSNTLSKIRLKKKNKNPNVSDSSPPPDQFLTASQPHTTTDHLTQRLFSTFGVNMASVDKPFEENYANILQSEHFEANYRNFAEKNEESYFDQDIPPLEVVEGQFPVIKLKYIPPVTTTLPPSCQLEEYNHICDISLQADFFYQNTNDEHLNNENNTNPDLNFQFSKMVLNNLKHYNPSLHLQYTTIGINSLRLQYEQMKCRQMELYVDYQPQFDNYELHHSVPKKELEIINTKTHPRFPSKHSQILPSLYSSDVLQKSNCLSPSMLYCSSFMTVFGKLPSESNFLPNLSLFSQLPSLFSETSQPMTFFSLYPHGSQYNPLNDDQALDQDDLSLTQKWQKYQIQHEKGDLIHHKDKHFQKLDKTFSQDEKIWTMISNLTIGLDRSLFLNTHNRDLYDLKPVQISVNISPNSHNGSLRGSLEYHEENCEFADKFTKSAQSFSIKHQHIPRNIRMELIQWDKLSQIYSPQEIIVLLATQLHKKYTFPPFSSRSSYPLTDTEFSFSLAIIKVLNTYRLYRTFSRCFHVVKGLELAFSNVVHEQIGKSDAINTMKNENNNSTNIQIDYTCSQSIPLRLYTGLNAYKEKLLLVNQVGAKKDSITLTASQIPFPSTVEDLTRDHFPKYQRDYDPSPIFPQIARASKILPIGTNSLFPFQIDFFQDFCNIFFSLIINDEIVRFSQIMLGLLRTIFLSRKTEGFSGATPVEKCKEYFASSFETLFPDLNQSDTPKNGDKTQQIDNTLKKLFFPSENIDFDSNISSPSSSDPSFTLKNLDEAIQFLSDISTTSQMVNDEADEVQIRQRRKEKNRLKRDQELNETICYQLPLLHTALDDLKQFNYGTYYALYQSLCSSLERVSHDQQTEMKYVSNIFSVLTNGDKIETKSHFEHFEHFNEFERFKQDEMFNTSSKLEPSSPMTFTHDHSKNDIYTMPSLFAVQALHKVGYYDEQNRPGNLNKRNGPNFVSKESAKMITKNQYLPLLSTTKPHIMLESLEKEILPFSNIPGNPTYVIPSTCQDEDLIKLCFESEEIQNENFEPISSHRTPRNMYELNAIGFINFTNLPDVKQSPISRQSNKNNFLNDNFNTNEKFNAKDKFNANNFNIFPGNNFHNNNISQNTFNYPYDPLDSHQSPPITPYTGNYGSSLPLNANLAMNLLRGDNFEGRNFDQSKLTPKNKSGNSKSNYIPYNQKPITYNTINSMKHIDMLSNPIMSMASLITTFHFLSNTTEKTEGKFETLSHQEYLSESQNLLNYLTSHSRHSRKLFQNRLLDTYQTNMAPIPTSFVSFSTASLLYTNTISNLLVTPCSQSEQPTVVINLLHTVVGKNHAYPLISSRFVANMGFSHQEFVEYENMYKSLSQQEREGENIYPFEAISTGNFHDAPGRRDLLNKPNPIVITKGSLTGMFVPMQMVSAINTNQPWLINLKNNTFFNHDKISQQNPTLNLLLSSKNLPLPLLKPFNTNYQDNQPTNSMDWFVSGGQGKAVVEDALCVTNNNSIICLPQKIHTTYQIDRNHYVDLWQKYLFFKREILTALNELEDLRYINNPVYNLLPLDTYASELSGDFDDFDDFDGSHHHEEQQFGRNNFNSDQNYQNNFAKFGSIFKPIKTQRCVATKPIVRNYFDNGMDDEDINPVIEYFWKSTEKRRSKTSTDSGLFFDFFQHNFVNPNVQHFSDQQYFQKNNSEHNIETFFSTPLSSLERYNYYEFAVWKKNGQISNWDLDIDTITQFSHTSAQQLSLPTSILVPSLLKQSILIEENKKFEKSLFGDRSEDETEFSDSAKDITGLKNADTKIQLPKFDFDIGLPTSSSSSSPGKLYRDIVHYPLVPQYWNENQVSSTNLIDLTHLKKPQHFDQNRSNYHFPGNKNDLSLNSIVSGTILTISSHGNSNHKLGYSQYYTKSLELLNDVDKQKEKIKFETAPHSEKITPQIKQARTISPAFDSKSIFKFFKTIDDFIFDGRDLFPEDLTPEVIESLLNTSGLTQPALDIYNNSTEKNISEILSQVESLFSRTENGGLPIDHRREFWLRDFKMDENHLAGWLKYAIQISYIQYCVKNGVKVPSPQIDSKTGVQTHGYDFNNNHHHLEQAFGGNFNSNFGSAYANKSDLSINSPLFNIPSFDKLTQEQRGSVAALFEQLQLKFNSNGQDGHKLRPQIDSQHHSPQFLLTNLLDNLFNNVDKISDIKPGEPIPDELIELFNPQDHKISNDQSANYQNLYSNLIAQMTEIINIFNPNFALKDTVNPFFIPDIPLDKYSNFLIPLLFPLLHRISTTLELPRGFTVKKCHHFDDFRQNRNHHHQNDDNSLSAAQLAHLHPQFITYQTLPGHDLALELTMLNEHMERASEMIEKDVREGFEGKKQNDASQSVQRGENLAICSTLSIAHKNDYLLYDSRSRFHLYQYQRIDPYYLDPDSLSYLIFSTQQEFEKERLYLEGKIKRLEQQLIPARLPQSVKPKKAPKAKKNTKISPPRGETNDEKFAQDDNNDNNDNNYDHYKECEHIRTQLASMSLLETKIINKIKFAQQNQNHYFSDSNIDLLLNGVSLDSYYSQLEKNNNDDLFDEGTNLEIEMGDLTTSGNKNIPFSEKIYNYRSTGVYPDFLNYKSIPIVSTEPALPQTVEQIVSSQTLHLHHISSNFYNTPHNSPILSHPNFFSPSSFLSPSNLLTESQIAPESHLLPFFVTNVPLASNMRYPIHSLEQAIYPLVGENAHIFAPNMGRNVEYARSIIQLVREAGFGQLGQLKAMEVFREEREKLGSSLQGSGVDTMGHIGVPVVKPEPEYTIWFGRPKQSFVMYSDGIFEKEIKSNLFYEKDEKIGKKQKEKKNNRGDNINDDNGNNNDDENTELFGETLFSETSLAELYKIFTVYERCQQDMGTYLLPQRADTFDILANDCFNVKLGFEKSFQRDGKDIFDHFARCQLENFDKKQHNYSFFKNTQSSSQKSPTPTLATSFDHLITLLSTKEHLYPTFYASIPALNDVDPQNDEIDDGSSSNLANLANFANFTPQFCKKKLNKFNEKINKLVSPVFLPFLQLFITGYQRYLRYPLNPRATSMDQISIKQKLETVTELSKFENVSDISSTKTNIFSTFSNFSTNYTTSYLFLNYLNQIFNGDILALLLQQSHKQFLSMQNIIGSNNLAHTSLSIDNVFTLFNPENTVANRTQSPISTVLENIYSPLQPNTIPTKTASVSSLYITSLYNVTHPVTAPSGSNLELNSIQIRQLLHQLSSFPKLLQDFANKLSRGIKNSQDEQPIQLSLIPFDAPLASPQPLIPVNNHYPLILSPDNNILIHDPGTNQGLFTLDKHANFVSKFEKLQFAHHYTPLFRQSHDYVSPLQSILTDMNPADLYSYVKRHGNFLVRSKKTVQDLIQFEIGKYFHNKNTKQFTLGRARGYNAMRKHGISYNKHDSKNPMVLPFISLPKQHVHFGQVYRSSKSSEKNPLILSRRLLYSGETNRSAIQRKKLRDVLNKVFDGDRKAVFEGELDGQIRNASKKASSQDKNGKNNGNKKALHWNNKTGVKFVRFHRNIYFHPSYVPGIINSGVGLWYTKNNVSLQRFPYTNIHPKFQISSQLNQIHPNHSKPKNSKHAKNTKQFSRISTIQTLRNKFSSDYQNHIEQTDPYHLQMNDSSSSNPPQSEKEPQYTPFNDYFEFHPQTSPHSLTPSFLLPQTTKLIFPSLFTVQLLHTNDLIYRSHIDANNRPANIAKNITFFGQTPQTFHRTSNNPETSPFSSPQNSLLEKLNIRRQPVKHLPHTSRSFNQDQFGDISRHNVVDITVPQYPNSFDTNYSQNPSTSQSPKNLQHSKSSTSHVPTPLAMLLSTLPNATNLSSPFVDQMSTLSSPQNYRNVTTYSTLLYGTSTTSSEFGESFNNAIMPFDIERHEAVLPHLIFDVESEYVHPITISYQYHLQQPQVSPILLRDDTNCALNLEDQGDLHKNKNMVSLTSQDGVQTALYGIEQPFHWPQPSPTVLTSYEHSLNSLDNPLNRAERLLNVDFGDNFEKFEKSKHSPFALDNLKDEESMENGQKPSISEGDFGFDPGSQIKDQNLDDEQELISYTTLRYLQQCEDEYSKTSLVSNHPNKSPSISQAIDEDVTTPKSTKNCSQFDKDADSGQDSGDDSGDESDDDDDDSDSDGDQEDDLGNDSQPKNKIKSTKYSLQKKERRNTLFPYKIDYLTEPFPYTAGPDIHKRHTYPSSIDYQTTVLELQECENNFELIKTADFSASNPTFAQTNQHKFDLIVQENDNQRKWGLYIGHHRLTDFDYNYLFSYTALKQNNAFISNSNFDNIDIQQKNTQPNPNDQSSNTNNNNSPPLHSFLSHLSPPLHPPIQSFSTPNPSMRSVYGSNPWFIFNDLLIKPSHEIVQLFPKPIYRYFDSKLPNSSTPGVLLDINEYLPLMRTYGYSGWMVERGKLGKFPGDENRDLLNHVSTQKISTQALYWTMFIPDVQINEIVHVDEEDNDPEQITLLRLPIQKKIQFNLDQKVNDQFVPEKTETSKSRIDLRKTNKIDVYPNKYNRYDLLNSYHYPHQPQFYQTTDIPYSFTHSFSTPIQSNTNSGSKNHSNSHNSSIYITTSHKVSSPLSNRSIISHTLSLGRDRPQIIGSHPLSHIPDSTKRTLLDHYNTNTTFSAHLAQLNTIHPSLALNYDEKTSFYLFLTNSQKKIAFWSNSLFRTFVIQMRSQLAQAQNFLQQQKWIQNKRLIQFHSVANDIITSHNEAISNRNNAGTDNGANQVENNELQSSLHTGNTVHIPGGLRSDAYRIGMLTASDKFNQTKGDHSHKFGRLYEKITQRQDKKFDYDEKRDKMALYLNKTHRLPLDPHLSRKYNRLVKTETDQYIDDDKQHSQGDDGTGNKPIQKFKPPSLITQKKRQDYERLIADLAKWIPYSANIERQLLLNDDQIESRRNLRILQENFKFLQKISALTQLRLTPELQRQKLAELYQERINNQTLESFVAGSVIPDDKEKKKPKESITFVGKGGEIVFKDNKSGQIMVQYSENNQPRTIEFSSFSQLQNINLPQDSSRSTEAPLLSSISSTSTTRSTDIADTIDLHSITEKQLEKLFKKKSKSQPDDQTPQKLRPSKPKVVDDAVFEYKFNSELSLDNATNEEERLLIEKRLQDIERVRLLRMIDQQKKEGTYKGFAPAKPVVMGKGMVTKSSTSTDLKRMIALKITEFSKTGEKLTDSLDHIEEIDKTVAAQVEAETLAKDAKKRKILGKRNAWNRKDANSNSGEKFRYNDIGSTDQSGGEPKKFWKRKSGQQYYQSNNVNAPRIKNKVIVDDDDNEYAIPQTSINRKPFGKPQNDGYQMDDFDQHFEIPKPSKPTRKLREMNVIEGEYPYDDGNDLYHSLQKIQQEKSSNLDDIDVDLKRNKTKRTTTKSNRSSIDDTQVDVLSEDYLWPTMNDLRKGTIPSSLIRSNERAQLRKNNRKTKEKIKLDNLNDNFNDNFDSEAMLKAFSEFEAQFSNDGRTNSGNYRSTDPTRRDFTRAPRVSRDKRPVKNYEKDDFEKDNFESLDNNYLKRLDGFSDFHKKSDQEIMEQSQLATNLILDLIKGISLTDKPVEAVNYPQNDIPKNQQNSNPTRLPNAINQSSFKGLSLPDISDHLGADEIYNDDFDGGELVPNDVHDNDDLKNQLFSIFDSFTTETKKGEGLGKNSIIKKQNIGTTKTPRSNISIPVTTANKQPIKPDILDEYDDLIAPLAKKQKNNSQKNYPQVRNNDNSLVQIPPPVVSQQNRNDVIDADPFAEIFNLLATAGQNQTDFGESDPIEENEEEEDQYYTQSDDDIRDNDSENDSDHSEDEENKKDEIGFDFFDQNNQDEFSFDRYDAGDILDSIGNQLNKQTKRR